MADCGPCDALATPASSVQTTEKVWWQGPFALVPMHDIPAS
jgi:hypothetical protein